MPSGPSIVEAATTEPISPWIMPSDMNGSRMNQLVAPTSFITETSRRRAKIAIRIVFRINTPAESSSTNATATNTHCNTVIVSSMAWICWLGAWARSTPGCPENRSTTAWASWGWLGVQRYEAVTVRS